MIKARNWCDWNAAGVVAFRDNKVALVFIDRKNEWDIVFGHVESGETPEETVRREALEEGGIQLEKTLIPILVFEDSNGINIVFRGEIATLVDLPAGYETSEMRLFSVPDAVRLASHYMQINRLLILLAWRSRRLS